MDDDYFSDEAIKARVNVRMRRFRWLFAHVLGMFVTIFAVIVLGALEAITPLAAVGIAVLVILSMIAHGMGFGLAMMREGFTEEEYKRAEQAAGKHKTEHYELGEDGELHTIDDEAQVFADQDASVRQQRG